ncbi:unnamed protein product [Cyprideis torosa]|uniref:Mediator of RNA polymerase II transcription subunit 13 n=1 Tax=Cyprideis torosa TaxID=163714 RepID=A0A7R8ZKW0_9CRUS|nr:unnamed protein product [Cyprideis torosa]CAG0882394.1 unnamed protein product [Cyprideis torosa]
MTNHHTNGASLEDCHTNFFALTDLCGIKWVKFSAPESQLFQDPPLEDPVLSAYTKCLSEDVLCVWRRMPTTTGSCSSASTPFGNPSGGPRWMEGGSVGSTNGSQNPSGLHMSKKELWIFWYGDDLDLSQYVPSSLLNGDQEPGSWETGLSYETRSLYFRSLHNLIERYLLRHDYVRLGKWYVQPFHAHDVLINSTSIHLAFSLHFFIHGESTVCCAVDVRQNYHVYWLTKEHLSTALGAQTQTGLIGKAEQTQTGLIGEAEQTQTGLIVMLGPSGLFAHLTGRSFDYSDPGVRKTLEDWNRFYPINTDKKSSAGPCSSSNGPSSSSPCTKGSPKDEASPTGDFGADPGRTPPTMDSPRKDGTGSESLPDPLKSPLKTGSAAASSAASDELPPVVEVIVGGVRMRYPSRYVLLTELDDINNSQIPGVIHLPHAPGPGSKPAPLGHSAVGNTVGRDRPMFLLENRVNQDANLAGSLLFHPPNAVPNLPENSENMDPMVAKQMASFEEVFDNKPPCNCSKCMKRQGPASLSYGFSPCRIAPASSGSQDGPGGPPYSSLRSPVNPLMMGGGAPGSGGGLFNGPLSSTGPGRKRPAATFHRRTWAQEDAGQACTLDTELLNHAPRAYNIGLANGTIHPPSALEGASSAPGGLGPAGGIMSGGPNQQRGGPPSAAMAPRTPGSLPSVRGAVCSSPMDSVDQSPRGSQPPSVAGNDSCSIAGMSPLDQPFSNNPASVPPPKTPAEPKMEPSTGHVGGITGAEGETDRKSLTGNTSAGNPPVRPETSLPFDPSGPRPPFGPPLPVPPSASWLIEAVPRGPLAPPSLPVSEYEATVEEDQEPPRNLIYDYRLVKAWFEHPVKRSRLSPASVGESPVKREADKGPPTPSHPSLGREGPPDMGGGGKRSANDPYAFDEDGTHGIDIKKEDCTSSLGVPPTATALQGGPLSQKNSSLFTSEGLEPSMDDMDHIFDSNDTGAGPTPPGSNKPAEGHPSPESMLGRAFLSQGKTVLTGPNAATVVDISKMFPTPPSHDNPPSHENPLLPSPGGTHDDFEAPIRSSSSEVLHQMLISSALDEQHGGPFSAGSATGELGLNGPLLEGESGPLLAEEEAPLSPVFQPKTVAQFVGPSKYAPLPLNPESRRLPAHLQPYQRKGLQLMASLKPHQGMGPSSGPMGGSRPNANLAGMISPSPGQVLPPGAMSPHHAPMLSPGGCGPHMGSSPMGPRGHLPPPPYHHAMHNSHHINSSLGSGSQIFHRPERPRLTSPGWPGGGPPPPPGTLYDSGGPRAIGFGAQSGPAPHHPPGAPGQPPAALPPVAPLSYPLLANLVVGDSALIQFRDHNFASCTVCVCNAPPGNIGNLKGSDGVYLPDSYLSKESEDCNAEGMNARCTCGFSAVVNRRLSYRAGLFYEDEVEITGWWEDIYDRRRPSLLVMLSRNTPSEQDMATVDRIPDSLLALIRGQSITFGSNHSLFAKTASLHRNPFNTHRFNFLEQKDGTEIVLAALEQCRILTSLQVPAFRMDGSTPPLLHKWCLLNSHSPVSSQVRSDAGERGAK